jgi:hypothetical protein
MRLVDENYVHDELDYLKFVVNYHVFICEFENCICKSVIEG